MNSILVNDAVFARVITLTQLFANNIAIHTLYTLANDAFSKHPNHKPNFLHLRTMQCSRKQQIMFDSQHIKGVKKKVF